MSTPADKIKEIESEIARTQKNKATNGHIGMLKAKLAKLKQDIITDATKATGGGGEGFDVAKTGDCRVGMIGFPSVGKSTLLTTLTGVFSEAAAYEFTTLTCIPGVFRYNGAKIQLLDLPGIIEGAKDGKGRGKQVIGVARTCNLILICLDVTKPLAHKRIIERELYGFGIRLNQRPPNVSFEKRDRGGINVISTVQMNKLDHETITAICKEYRVSNATFHIRDDITADEFVDVLQGNRVYMPAIIVMNKIDGITIEELELVDRMPHYVPISARHKWNLDRLVQECWDRMNLTRVYTKPKGEWPDFKSPIILKDKLRTTVNDLCKQIHKTLVDNFKYAWVWGRSVRFNPQKVGIEHILADEDVVQIVKK